MSNIFYCESSYLAHYGVKGMKWGIRRYQNYDGTYTKTGKARLKLSDKNKEILKKVAITAGIAAGSAAVIAAAYYGAPYVQRNILGITIRAGQTLQTLSADPNRIQNGADYYAAIRKGDKERYKARWGQAVKINWGNADSLITKENKFNIEQKAIKKVKIAPRNKAAKVMNELIKKDDDFALYAKEQLAKQDSALFGGGAYQEHAKLFREIRKNPSKLYNLNPKEQRLVFEAVNVQHIEHDPRANPLIQALKEKGFGGMIDTNDAKLRGGSQFNTNAVIIFGGNKDIIQDSVKKLSDVEINNAKTIDKYIDIATNNMYKSPAAAALVATPVSAIAFTSKSKNTNIKK